MNSVISVGDFRVQSIAGLILAYATCLSDIIL